jgi:AraC-like DNA-binding protein
MIFRTHAPSPPLSPFVNVIWFCESDAPAHSRERVLPDGSMQLVINLREDRTRVYDRTRPDRCRTLPGFVVSGARSECAEIDTAEQACLIGVHFKPGGAVPFLGLPASELRNAHVSMDALWGSASIDLRDRLVEAETPEARIRILEQALLARAGGFPRAHPAVDHALREFLRMPGMRTMAVVAQGSGLSPRRFIQLFDERVGLTPKLFCRVRRFQEALGRVARGGRVEWADLAADCGYYDQAHFIHDFTAFSGMSPSAYLGRRTGHPSHVRAAA